jgi:predicted AlkP superfamily phosphohydrolase/phosphomutase
LGLNGLYLNLRGRERDGIVASEARQALLDELSVRLESVVDPETGEKPVRRVLRRDEAYREHDHDRLGPDLIVGYAEGYRSSNESAIGGTPPGILADNTSEWSGDHCIDPEVVPGILLVNRPLAQPAPDLRSLSQALLAEMRRDGR